MSTENLTIGRLAKRASVNVETVRFYERRGLLKQPRKKGAFRHYPETDIQRIRFIKRCQELGFTLKEAKELLDIKIKSQAKCGDVLTKTNQKIDEVEQKIRDLRKIKKSLKKIERCCTEDNGLLSDCPILDSFLEYR